MRPLLPPPPPQKTSPLPGARPSPAATPPTALSRARPVFHRPFPPSPDGLLHHLLPSPPPPVPIHPLPRYRIEDFGTPELLARHACELAGLPCATAKATGGAEGGSGGEREEGEGDGGGMMSELLVALGLKAAVRGHHREHDECPHEELRRMDSELAGKIEVMAARYGYESAGC